MEGDPEDGESIESLKQKICRLEASRAKLREGLSLMREKAINTHKLMGKFKEHAERCKGLEHENQCLLERLAQRDGTAGNFGEERERQLKTEYELRISILQDTVSRLETSLEKANSDLCASRELVESTQTKSTQLYSKVESLSLALEGAEKALEDERNLRKKAETKASEESRQRSLTDQLAMVAAQDRDRDNREALQTAIYNHWSTLELVAEAARIEIRTPSKALLQGASAHQKHKEKATCILIEDVYDSDRRQQEGSETLQIENGECDDPKGSSSAGNVAEKSGQNPAQTTPETATVETGYLEYSHKRKGNCDSLELKEARSKKTKACEYQDAKHSGLSASSTQTQNMIQTALNPAAHQFGTGAKTNLQPHADYSKNAAACQLNAEHITRPYTGKVTTLTHRNGQPDDCVPQKLSSKLESTPELAPKLMSMQQVYRTSRISTLIHPKILKERDLVRRAIQNVMLPPYYVKRCSQILVGKILKGDQNMVSFVAHEITNCLLWTDANPAAKVQATQACDKNACLRYWQEQDSPTFRIICTLVRLIGIVAKSEGCEQLPWILWNDITKVATSYLKFSSESFAVACAAAGASGYLCTMLKSKQLWRIFCTDLLMLAGRSERSTIPILFVFLRSCPEVLSQSSEGEDIDQIVLSAIMGMCGRYSKSVQASSPDTVVDQYAATELFKLGVQYNWWSHLSLPSAWNQELHKQGIHYADIGKTEQKSDSIVI